MILGTTDGALVDVCFFSKKPKGFFTHSSSLWTLVSASSGG
jgi:hypothetical protein